MLDSAELAPNRVSVCRSVSLRYLLLGDREVINWPPSRQLKEAIARQIGDYF